MTGFVQGSSTYRVAERRKLVVVSNDIFWNGATDDSMPIRLNGL